MSELRDFSSLSRFSPPLSCVTSLMLHTPTSHRQKLRSISSNKLTSESKAAYLLWMCDIWFTDRAECKYDLKKCLHRSNLLKHWSLTSSPSNSPVFLLLCLSSLHWRTSLSFDILNLKIGYVQTVALQQGIQLLQKKTGRCSEDHVFGNSFCVLIQN